MSLADVQDAVARLVCDRADLEAYTRAPREWLHGRVPPGDVRLLAELDESALRMFHDIHTRDRAYFVEAVMPWTTARLGPEWQTRYFDTFPFGNDDTHAECARFVRHLESSATAPSTIALARLELATFELQALPPFEPQPRANPPHAMLRLAPGIAVVPSSVYLPALVDDPTADVRPRAGVVLLRRDASGVTTAWLEGPAAALLAAIHAADAAALASLLSTQSGRAALTSILDEGVVA